MQKKLSSSIALVAIAAIVLAVNLIGTLLFPGVKVDVTAEKLFTLSQGSRNIASSVENEVAMKFFYSKTAIADIPPLKVFANRVTDLLEEYVAVSDGKLSLETIDPRPDTEEEEAADLAGLQGVQAQGGQGGQGRIFIGLQITDKDSGQETIIPFLNPSNEATLEYDISKALSSIANPNKKRVGVISSLPVMGGPPQRMNPMMPQQQPQQQPWAIIRQLRQNFQVDNIASDAAELPKNLDLLVLIHPKALSPALEYQIDQYVMRGGNALLFVDAMCEVDMRAMQQQMGGQQNMQAMMQASFNSIVPKPFATWGVKMIAGQDQQGFGAMTGAGPSPQIVLDQNIGWDAQLQDGSLRKVFSYLRLTGENMDPESIVTSKLSAILMPTAGAFEEIPGSDNLKVETLLETSEEASTADGMMMKFGGNPLTLNDSYKPGSVKLPLAYKITGKFKSAYPDGQPNPEAPDSPLKLEGHLSEASSESVLVVVADVDMISDQWAVDVMNFFGQTIIQPKRDNSNFAFLANVTENLVGSKDLISLRSRGTSDRPFTRVQAIQHKAEKEFQQEEKKLVQELADANQRWEEIKSKTTDGAILTNALSDERNNIKKKQVDTRKALREVRLHLREKVEALGFILKFINIALIPCVVIFLSLLISVIRSMGRKRAA